MSARNTNFGIAQRERERRIAGLLEDPYDTTAGTAISDPAGNAFWGSLRELGQRAADNGMGFRADVGSLGSLPGGGGGRLTPTDIAGIQGNVALGQMADENAARQLAVKAALDQRDAANRADMHTSYDDQVFASTTAPPPAQAVSQTVGPNGEPLYTIKPNAAETPRDRFLSMLPGPVRAQYEKQFAAEDLAKAAQEETVRSHQATEALAGASTLSTDAIDQNARQYIQTGVMPTLGMKDPGNRAKILNRAAEITQGGGGDIAANKAAYKADAGSLTAMQKQRDAIGAFENTAGKNMDVFLKAAGKVADTGSPLLNMPVRAVSGKVLGSENQAEYEAARAVLLPEISRIITNPNLTGVLSDSARQEVSAFNPETATLGQTIKVMKLLKQDMGNRVGSLDEQIKTIKGRIGGSSADASAPKSDDYRKKYNY